MQIVTVTKTALFSEAFTLPMLTEVAVRYLGMSDEAVQKTAAATLAKASKAVGNLTYAKLRTVIATKLGNHPDYNDTFNSNELQLEFDCLPDLDMGNAGSNTRRKASTTGTKRASTAGVALQGTYTLGPKKFGAKCEGDKARVYALLFANNSFEAYFAACQAENLMKVVREGKTGPVAITAGEFARWAIKSGWITVQAAA